MKDEVFDADDLDRLRRNNKGLEELVQIIDTGSPSHIRSPCYRLLISDNQSVVIGLEQQ